MNHHAVKGLSTAGLDEVRLSFYFHGTYAASLCAAAGCTGRLEVGMVADGGDIDAGLIGRFYDGVGAVCTYGFTVDGELYL
jgi:hypothetical protein